MIDMKGIGRFTPFVITVTEDEVTRQPDVKKCSSGYKFLHDLSQGRDFAGGRRTIGLSSIYNIVGIESIGLNRILIIAQTEEEFNTNRISEGVEASNPEGAHDPSFAYREPVQVPVGQLPEQPAVSLETGE